MNPQTALNLPKNLGAGAGAQNASLDPEQMKAFAAVVGTLQGLLKQALDPHADPGRTLAAMMLGPMMKDLTGHLSSALGSNALNGLQLPRKP